MGYGVFYVICSMASSQYVTPLTTLPRFSEIHNFFTNFKALELIFILYSFIFCTFENFLTLLLNIMKTESDYIYESFNWTY